MSRTIFSRIHELHLAGQYAEAVSWCDLALRNMNGESEAETVQLTRVFRLKSIINLDRASSNVKTTTGSTGISSSSSSSSISPELLKIDPIKTLEGLLNGPDQLSNEKALNILMQYLIEWSVGGAMPKFDSTVPKKSYYAYAYENCLLLFNASHNSKYLAWASVMGLLDARYTPTQYQSIKLAPCVKLVIEAIEALDGKEPDGASLKTSQTSSPSPPPKQTGYRLKAASEDKHRDRGEYARVYLEIMMHVDNPQQVLEEVYNGTPDYEPKWVLVDQELACKNLELLAKLERHEDVVRIATNAIKDEGHQDWTYFVQLIESSVQLDKSSTDKSDSTKNSYLDKAADLVKVIPETYPVLRRAALLAGILIGKHRLDLAEKDSSLRGELFLEQTKRIVEFINKYGDRPSCFGDIKPYLVRDMEITSSSGANLPFAAQLLLEEIIWFLDYTPNGSVKELTTFANTLFARLWKSNVLQNKKEDDWHLAYRSIRLSAHALLLANSKSPAASHLSRALAMVYSGLNAYPKCHYLLVLALRIHQLCGSPAEASEIYQALRIKHIQHTTLSHLLSGSFMRVGGQASREHEHSFECLAEQREPLSAANDAAVEALRSEAISRLVEFVEFKDRYVKALPHKINLMMVIRYSMFTERDPLNLRQRVNNLTLNEAEWTAECDKDFVDLRDFSIIPCATNSDLHPELTLDTLTRRNVMGYQNMDLERVRIGIRKFTANRQSSNVESLITKLHGLENEPELKLESTVIELTCILAEIATELMGASKSVSKITELASKVGDVFRRAQADIPSSSLASSNVFMTASALEQCTIIVQLVQEVSAMLFEYVTYLNPSAAQSISNDAGKGGKPSSSSKGKKKSSNPPNKSQSKAVPPKPAEPASHGLNAEAVASIKLALQEIASAAATSVTQTSKSLNEWKASLKKAVSDISAKASAEIAAQLAASFSLADSKSSKGKGKGKKGKSASAAATTTAGEDTSSAKSANDEATAEITRRAVEFPRTVTTLSWSAAFDELSARLASSADIIPTILAHL
ncbi:hypothetical protein GQ42DRAFT_33713 [Ramicandelaber brevisporus]|nr:hypothetical protein GQ42DRAFT_33713 [Ramicandelaber brevisporus]